MGITNAGSSIDRNSGEDLTEAAREAGQRLRRAAGEKRSYSVRPPISAARGIAIGLILGALLWFLIIVAIF